jgi:thiol-disulfide isomerase/thioredoxin
MKIMLIFLFSFFLSVNLNSQIIWLRNYEAAKTLAAKTDKLIIMDFWASWCNPCTVMEDKLWGNEEMKKLAANFVFLKLNSDYDLKQVSQYGVRAIPRVIVITAGEEILLDKLGFLNAESYLVYFRALPGNVGELNHLSVAQAADKKDFATAYALGKEYQKFGKTITNSDLKITFLTCSDKYLAKAMILCEEPSLMEEVELYTALNHIYAGREQKAFKIIEKLNSNPGNEELGELRLFVLAECYKSMGDKESFLKYKQQIKKQDLIGQLDE